MTYTELPLSREKNFFFSHLDIPKRRINEQTKYYNTNMHSKHILYMYVCVCMCKMNNIKQKHHWPHFKDIEREREREGHSLCDSHPPLPVCEVWRLEIVRIHNVSKSVQPGVPLLSTHGWRRERERE